MSGKSKTCETAITTFLEKVPRKSAIEKLQYNCLNQTLSSLCKTNTNVNQHLKAAVERSVRLKIGDPKAAKSLTAPHYVVDSRHIWIEKDSIPTQEHNSTILHQHLKTGLVQTLESAFFLASDDRKVLTKEAVQTFLQASLKALNRVLHATQILTTLRDHPQHLDPRAFIGTNSSTNNLWFPMLYSPSDLRLGEKIITPVSGGVLVTLQIGPRGHHLANFESYIGRIFRSIGRTPDHAQWAAWNLISRHPDATAALSTTLALASHMHSHINETLTLHDCLNIATQVLAISKTGGNDSVLPLDAQDHEPSLFIPKAMYNYISSETCPNETAQQQYSTCFAYLSEALAINAATEETGSMPSIAAMKGAILKNPRTAEGLEVQAIQTGKNAAVSQFTISLATGLMDSAGASEKSKMIVAFIIQTATLMCLGASFGSAITSTTISTAMNALSTRLEKNNMFVAQAISLGSSVIPTLLREGGLFQNIYLFTLSAAFGWLGSQAGLTTAAVINAAVDQTSPYSFSI